MKRMFPNTIRMVKECSLKELILNLHTVCLREELIKMNLSSLYHKALLHCHGQKHVNYNHEDHWSPYHCLSSTLFCKLIRQLVNL